MAAATCSLLAPPSVAYLNLPARRLPVCALEVGDRLLSFLPARCSPNSSAGDAALPCGYEREKREKDCAVGRRARRIMDKVWGECVK
jgi:hypothetical protein